VLGTVVTRRSPAVQPEDPNAAVRSPLEEFPHKPKG
jgi:hypothetical protein